MAWNRPSENKVEKRGGGGRGKSNSRLLFAGLVVVVGGALALWLTLGDRGEANAPQSRKTRRAKAEERTPVRAGTGADDSAAKRPAARSAVQPRKDETEVVRSNAVQKVTKPKTWTRDPNAFYLDSESDQMIALLFMHDGGDQPPLPDNPVSDQAFLKSLKTPIVIKETDNERTKLLKNTLIEVRKELKERLDAGESVNSVLQNHQADYNFKERTRLQAAREARALYQKGDLEGTADYVSVINQALEQMGIDPIEDPRSTEEKQEGKDDNAEQTND